MLADGDMIGDHTWSHANVAADGSFAAAQILRTAATIRAATGGLPHAGASLLRVGRFRSGLPRGLPLRV
jgi:hypothetical protein